jgi:hypothetical protein
MSETTRVQRWREAKRQEGLKAVTLWLTTEEALRLKDVARQWHCSPSALVQHALAQFSPQTAPGISPATDMPQLRELIQAEFLAMQGEKLAVTDTVTEVVTATLARDLPELVRQLVEGLALEALGVPGTAIGNGDVTDIDDDMTDTNGNIPATEALDFPVPATYYGNATDTERPDEEGGEPGQRQTRRPRGAMRQRIVALLGAHPEGLSAEQIRVYLQAEQPLGDTLQGMRRQGKVHTRGQGKDLRYCVA